MKKESKKIRSVRYVSEFEDIYACPICQSDMQVQSLQRLICTNSHTFDFAKQGYLNLTTRQIQTKYRKGLFESRKRLMTESEFFEPIIHHIAQAIDRECSETVSIIDMGCGEGSHLVHLCQRLETNFEKSTLGVGVDIAKEGIMVAAKNDVDRIWTVADLANTPFKDGQFDVILNILSPSNYAEFDRLVKTNGIVVKVVPRNDYLRELREILFQDPEKQSYSNTGTVELFRDHYQSVDVSRVNYTIDLDPVALKWLFEMTPLTWNVTEEQANSFLKKDSTEMTVDVDILIGKHA